MEDFMKFNNYLSLDSIQDFIEFFNFKKEPLFIEEDINNSKKILYLTDINNRKYLDLLVLSYIAANVPNGKMLDIGTYYGNSAARMAINSPNSTVFTVNIHPKDKTKTKAKAVTEILSEDKIGSFYKKYNLNNIKQIFADTLTWEIPDEINDLQLVYIDGCHDTRYVINDSLKIYDRVVKNGYILWHDFSPKYRKNFYWIDKVMSGIEKLNFIKNKYIFNLNNSWIGIFKKD